MELATLSITALLIMFHSDWLRTGRSGFDSRRGLRIFLSRPALGPTQPHIQWVPGALSLGGKTARV